MNELSEIKESVHTLETEISGLKPIVSDIHANMPRIAKAMETLARATERLNSHEDEHKRLHYRISETDKRTKDMHSQLTALNERMNGLWQEHIDCQARLSARKEAKKEEKENLGWWERLKQKVAEQVAVFVVLGVIAFFLWVVIYHLPQYPATAPIIDQGRAKQSGPKE